MLMLKDLLLMAYITLLYYISRYKWDVDSIRSVCFYIIGLIALIMSILALLLLLLLLYAYYSANTASYSRYIVLLSPGSYYYYYFILYGELSFHLTLRYTPGLTDGLYILRPLDTLDGYLYTPLPS
jgi:hypothetical protein